MEAPEHTSGSSMGRPVGPVCAETCSPILVASGQRQAWEELLMTVSMGFVAWQGQVVVDSAQRWSCSCPVTRSHHWLDSHTDQVHRMGWMV